MRRFWNFYKLACASVVTLALVILVGAALARTLATPTADVAAPQGPFRLQVFAAGQGAIPPDYRSDVRFYLYDRNRPPLFRRVLVATAPYADGWNVTWAGARDVTIALGPLSFVNFSRASADDVNIHVTIAASLPGEAACVGQAFGNTIDGINCFDRLLVGAGTARQ